MTSKPVLRGLQLRGASFAYAVLLGLAMVAFWPGYLLKPAAWCWSRGLKPRADPEWHLVDKAIDKALDVPRSSKPDGAACRKAIGKMIAAVNDGVAK